jgi:stage V sporulation protein B
MKTHVAKGTIYLTGSSILFLLSGYVINILLGRFLGPTIYGVYGIIISLITVINLMQTSGLPQAVSNYISANEKNAEAIYKTGFFIQIISTISVSLLFIIFSNMIATVLKDPSLTSYLRLAAGIFPCYGLFALLSGYYNGLHFFKYQAVLHSIYSLLKIGTILFFARLFGLYGVILGFIISPLIAIFFGLHNPKKTAQIFPYKKLLAFSLPLIALAIFSNLLQSIDLFFIKAILKNNTLAGYYTANQNIAEIPFYISTALSTVLFPSIAKHTNQNMQDDARNLISTALRFATMIIIPGVIVIAATSFQILSFLFSPSFVAGAGALSILAIGSGFFTLFSLLSSIISGSGSPGKPMILAALGLLLSCVLCSALIKPFGIIGAALSTTIASGIIMFIAAIFVYRRFSILFSFISLFKISVASFIIFLLIKLFNFPTIFLPFFYILLFVVYSSILIVCKEITKKDLLYILSILPKFSAKN